MVQIVIFITFFFVPVLALYIMLHKAEGQRIEFNFDILLQYCILVSCNIPLTKIFAAFIRKICGVDISVDSGYYTLAALAAALLIPELYGIYCFIRKDFRKAEFLLESWVSAHVKVKKRVLSVTSIIMGIILVAVIVMTSNGHVMEEEPFKYGFAGNGTQASPYLISSVNDLEHFRDLVNAGESFAYRYFKQIEDLDLQSIGNWTPIGVHGSGNYFQGNYDGGGHSLSNLYCIWTAQDEMSNVGLFGYLSGEVRNLGIESGQIEGVYVGSIASDGSTDAVIINCYNKANIMGERAGGIVDNFGGSVLFCFNMGEVTGAYSAGISSYNCKEISYCYSTAADNLTTVTSFSGSISDSMCLAKKDMNQDFIKNYYKALNKWTSAYIDKEGLVRIVIKDGDIRFAQNSINLSSSNILIAILAVVLAILIFSDYIVNVKWKDRTTSKEIK